MVPLITRLNDNEVFVFGSNAGGFHGSGAAGMACRGSNHRKPWRQDPWFIRAMNSPVGSPDRIGHWAVFGIARGWTKGHMGMSYAIETIKKAGDKRSTPLPEIRDQIQELIRFCREKTHWTFLFTPVGGNLAGYSDEEMGQTLFEALDLENCYDFEGDYCGPRNLKIFNGTYEQNWQTRTLKKEKVALQV